MNADVYAEARQRMVEEVRRMSRELSDGEPWPISERVLAVMGRVPRHRFVPEGELSCAYYNRPLPIGHGQTISQPYIVALMTDLLLLEKGQRVLEVGAGSGYQTTLLAELAGEVYSLEIVESLAMQAVRRLHELGYANVHLQAGDGNRGWPEHAPFDAIIVTAAPTHVPQALLDQLKPGGRMVVPVGGIFEAQRLLLITKDEAGAVHSRSMAPVRFVPLTGGGRA